MWALCFFSYGPNAPKSHLYGVGVSLWGGYYGVIGGGGAFFPSRFIGLVIWPLKETEGFSACVARVMEALVVCGALFKLIEALSELRYIGLSRYFRASGSIFVINIAPLS